MRCAGTQSGVLLMNRKWGADPDLHAPLTCQRCPAAVPSLGPCWTRLLSVNHLQLTEVTRSRSH